MGEEEEPFLTTNKVVLSLILVGLPLLLGKLYRDLVVKPKRIRSKLQKQGITGPPPVFLYGNIPEITRIQLQARSVAAAAKADAEKTTPVGNGGGGGENLSHAWPARVFPHFPEWNNQYGPVFLYSNGNLQMLCVMDPEMVKELSLFSSLNLGRPLYISKDRGPLLGEGIFSSNGPYWSFQRKLIAPEFYLDKVKGLISLIYDSTSPILQSWESKTKGEQDAVEISVEEDLRILSADIIARACFGSSHSQTEEIFLNLQVIQQMMSTETIGVPVLRYIPTKHNREMWRLTEETDSMILNLVKARRQTQHDKDFLQVIIDAAKNVENNHYILNETAANKFIIDNCKSLYFAGHETTAGSAAWCLMLLAAHPDWQARVRSEVLEISGCNPPDADKLRSMKLLNMVIQEALRLYPPVAFTVREALEDIRIKGIELPKGIIIQVPAPFLHQHPELWGPDAKKFNPERFVDGISGACKIPQAYMPFGFGARNCLGHNFAMVELKVILSAILSRFTFSLSPEYHHSPAFQLVIRPQYGIKLHMRALE